VAHTSDNSLTAAEYHHYPWGSHGARTAHIHTLLVRRRFRDAGPVISVSTRLPGKRFFCSIFPNEHYFVNGRKIIDEALAPEVIELLDESADDRDLLQSADQLAGAEMPLKSSLNKGD